MENKYITNNVRRRMKEIKPENTFKNKLFKYRTTQ